MNLKDIMLSEISHSQKDKESYETLRVGKFIEAESTMVVARGRVRSHCLMDIEFQFHKMKRLMGDGWW